jgi:hypothetical protein
MKKRLIQADVDEAQVKSDVEQAISNIQFDDKIVKDFEQRFNSKLRLDDAFIKAMDEADVNSILTEDVLDSLSSKYNEDDIDVDILNDEKLRPLLKKYQHAYYEVAKKVMMEQLNSINDRIEGSIENGNVNW